MSAWSPTQPTGVHAHERENGMEPNASGGCTHEEVEGPRPVGEGSEQLDDCSEIDDVMEVSANE